MAGPSEPGRAHSEKCLTDSEFDQQHLADLKHHPRSEDVQKTPMKIRPETYFRHTRES